VHQRCYLPGVWFGYFQYGLPIATRAVGRDDYWGPDAGRRPNRGHWLLQQCHLRYSARRRALADAYRLLPCPVRQSLRSSLPFPHQGQPRRTARRPARQATNRTPRVCAHHRPRHGVRKKPATLRVDGRRGPGTDRIGAVEPHVQQFIITALLLSPPHNYSNALRCLEKPIAPRDVRRAVDYIEAHLDQAITVADLVAATGVAGRTLFMHFKRFKGISPMRYARDDRLRKARQALLRAYPETSVTDIALNAGSPTWAGSRSHTAGTSEKALRTRLGLTSNRPTFGRNRICAALRRRVRVGNFSHRPREQVPSWVSFWQCALRRESPL